MAVSEAALSTAPGGGVFAGDGFLFNAIALLLVQILIVIITCRILGIFLRKYFWQPNVIAEVIGGILLGPTFLGQSDKYMTKIFPKTSLGSFKLVAELGLIFFLFIIGMELDPGLLRMNVKQSFAISAAGIVLPFALSLGVSHLMYQTLPGIKEGSGYGSFALFIGVSNSVTAFPVLSRILTENKLLRTLPGVASISAAAFDDVAVWCLLALTIAVVNASTPLQALWVFLSMAVFASVMLTVGKTILYKVCTKLSRDWSQINDTVMFICLATALACSYVAVVLGVDAIFGAFIAGLMVPRRHGLAVHITEKIEDLTTAVLLPLYFANSGLKTDLTTLDSGRQWGFVVLVVLIACLGKLLGCGVAARCCGIPNRESAAIAILMNCRGLVELIILNIGLDAGVINVEVFGILVIMALVTTFMTSPLVRWVYPPQYHYDPAIGPNKKPIAEDANAMLPFYDSLDDIDRAVSGLRVLVCIPGKRAATSVIKIVHMLNASHGNPPKNVKNGSGPAVVVTAVPVPGGGPPRRDQEDITQMSIHAVRMIQLPDGRFSSDMKAVDSIHTLRGDEVADLLRAYSKLHQIGMRMHLAMAPEYYAGSAYLPGEGVLCRDLTDLLTQHNLNTIVVPWEEHHGLGRRNSSHDLHGPSAVYDNESDETKEDPEISSSEHTKIVQDLLAVAPGRVAVLVDRGFNAMGSSLDRRRVLVPFFGGADDEDAVMMAIALSRDTMTEAHITWIRASTGGKEPTAVFPATFPSTANPTPGQVPKPSALKTLVETMEKGGPDAGDATATAVSPTAGGGKAAPSLSGCVSREEAFLKLVDSAGLATVSETYVATTDSNSLVKPVHDELQQWTNSRYAYSLVIVGHAGGRTLRAGVFQSTNKFAVPRNASGAGEELLKHRSLHVGRSSTPDDRQHSNQHTWGRVLAGSSLSHVSKHDTTANRVLGEIGGLLIRSELDISVMAVHRSSAGTSLGDVDNV